MPNMGGEKMECFIVGFLSSKTGQKDHLAIDHGSRPDQDCFLTFFVL